MANKYEHIYSESGDGITLDDIIARIDSIISDCVHFKIGMTGQDVEDRYNNGYSEDYDKIEELTWSDDEEQIIEIEKELIELYIEDEKNDNDQVGSGEMDQDTDVYSVYIVWSE